MRRFVEFQLLPVSFFFEVTTFHLVYSYDNVYGFDHR